MPYSDCGLNRESGSERIQEERHGEMANEVSGGHDRYRKLRL